jgi:hypothetical protein
MGEDGAGLSCPGGSEVTDSDSATPKWLAWGAL